MLGHVAHALADLQALRARVQVEDAHVARGGGEQAEEDLDEGALAGAVGADEPDDAGLQLQGKPLERRHAAGIALGRALVR